MPTKTRTRQLQAWRASKTAVWGTQFAALSACLPRVVVLQNFESDELRLKQPLYVNLETDEDGTVVMSSMDLNVFGYADTEYGAKRDFVRSITDLYYNLKDEKKNLHKSALPLWSFMQEMLEEK